MNDLKGIIEDCNKSDLVSDKIIKKIIEIIGQEEWQDLHDENNDVCTTMGELIITLEGISELEKENAELKEKNKWYSEQVCNKECAEVWGNLTKAKEIIKYLLSFIQKENYKTRWDINITEAEQFLNSEVESNHKWDLEMKPKEQNKDWMYLQRERNELGADYFSYQGYHPPKK